MSETDTGSSVPPFGENQGNFAPEPSSSFPKKEAAKLQGSNTDLHSLEGDPAKKAEEFEEKRKSDLNAEREEHLRRRSGGEVREQ